MADVAVQNIVASGLEPVFAAATAADDVPCGDNIFFVVKNGDVADKTVTLETPNTVGGLAIADQAIVVTAGEERWIGPLPAHMFKRSATGKARFTYSALTSVTRAAFAL